MSGEIFQAGCESCPPKSPSNPPSPGSKCRFFSHGRIFGIHNPFDEDIRKAADPYINLRTLARLSHSADDSLREETAKNLSARLGCALAESQIRRFNPDVVARALALANKCIVNPAIHKCIHGFSMPLLENAARSHSPAVLEEILKVANLSRTLYLDICQRLPREVLIRAALGNWPSSIRKYLDPDLADAGFEAYHVFEARFMPGCPYRSLPQSPLTTGELETLSASASRRVLESVVSHAESSASAIARAISGLTPKTLEVVKPAEIIGYETQSASDVAAEGKDPCQVPCETYPVYSQEERYLTYGQSDVRAAASLLISFPRPRRGEIFKKLVVVNPELSAALTPPTHCINPSAQDTGE